MTEIRLEPSWKQVLADEFNKDHMLHLKQFLLQQKQAGKTVYPKGSEYFRALDLTPFEQVKVVILGQDPYHGPGQAHGLCFSVQPGIQPPPSLVNMYKEMQEDLGIPPVQHGFLQHWAEQGVLLLNSVLTVEHKQAASHQGQGWEQFTDRVIAELNEHRENLVFILWGSYAQRKAAVVDTSRHLVLKAPHPSPLSAYRGFFGSKPFSKTNQYLQQHGITPIDWKLPEMVAEPA
ncbi:uracil-DNA glycosylase [Spongorhabdus nitratireducens]